MAKKIVSVVGARPQFIKAAPVSKALRRAGWREVLVHTGQHYDDLMSEVFFRELDIPAPDCNLGVGSGSHGRQTGLMLMALEEVLLRERPDWVLVYGDTNSTAAASLAAVKLGLPLAHVEAGLRSFDMTMPEEINRRLTDAISDLLFVTEESGMRNLRDEGVAEDRIHLVGNVMIDTLQRNLARIESGEFVPSPAIRSFCATSDRYAVLTPGRASTRAILNSGQPARDSWRSGE